MSKKNSLAPTIRSSAAEYLAFVAASGEGGIEAIYADEDVWLSQKMLAVLYDVNVRTVNEHLKKIFADSELQEEAVIRKFRITKFSNNSCSENIFFKCSLTVRTSTEKSSAISFCVNQTFSSSILTRIFCLSLRV